MSTNLELRKTHTYTADYEKKGKRRVIPPHIIRQLAHESTEGGTFYCSKCHMRFSMKYSRFGRFKSDPFTRASDNYCKDCADEDNGFIKQPVM